MGEIKNRLKDHFGKIYWLISLNDNLLVSCLSDKRIKISTGKLRS
jgi:hypothetical protein